MEIRPASGAPVNGERSFVIDACLAGALRKRSLTPAQMRIAIALFKGRSVTEYAQQTGISINTARWHVKQIYSKAGVNRQTQLFHTFLQDMGLIRREI